MSPLTSTMRVEGEEALGHDRFVISTIFLGVLAGLLLVVLLTGTASAVCVYPGSGDWTINNGETCTVSTPVPPATIDVSGNLVVQTGGNLTLNGVTLRMDGASDGQRRIDIQNGGAFNAINGANITSVSTNIEYKFLVRPGASVTIDRSTVTECGFDATSDENIGMRVESDSVDISRSTFVDNFAGVYVKGSSPTIGTRY